MYEQYIDDVLSGNRIEGELRQLLVKRHVRDLKRQNTDDFQYHFCPESAEHAIKVISKFRHTKGKKFRGKLWDMRPFMAFNLAMIFGWKNEEGFRKYRTLYEEVAKKSAKTERAAARKVYMGIFDGESGAELYNVATTEFQAGHVFNATKRICEYLIQDDRALRKVIRTMAREIRIIDVDNLIKLLPSNADGIEGSGPHEVTIDEYHLFILNEVIENFTSAMAHMDQPLLQIETTAGNSKSSPCYEMRKYGVGVLKGNYVDEAFFPTIHSLDNIEEEWQDPEMWIKCCPLIGTTPTWTFMRNEMQTAINRGGEKLRRFKMKNLNIWPDGSSDYIPYKWVEASWDDKVTLDRLRGRKCILGVDLASDYDLSAVSALFPPSEDDPFFYIIRKYFICEDAVQERREKHMVNYDDWIEMGLIINTGGDVTDYEYIEEYIAMIGEICRIVVAGFDNWNSSQTRVRLHRLGLQHVAISQTTGTLNNATRMLRTIHRTKTVKTPIDPVYGHMMSNVELKRDHNGNEKPDKNASREKIDGVVADVNALALYLNPDRYKDIPDIGTGFYFPKDSNDG